MGDYTPAVIQAWVVFCVCDMARRRVVTSHEYYFFSSQNIFLHNNAGTDGRILIIITNINRCTI